MTMRKEHMKQQGFTLVELLVVLVVIGTLMGLLFPAYNIIRQRAWDTTGRDLCFQTAAAWNALYLQHRRLPGKALFDEAGEVTTLANGDIQVVMNNKTASLLNWWKPRHPDPGTDVAEYRKWLQYRGITFSRYGVNNWPKNLNDLYLERTSEQRQWGIVAPWVRRWVSGQDETTVNHELVEAGMVRVLLDMNGDGKITLPPELGGIELMKTAAAWVYADEKRSRVLTSW